MCNWNTAKVAKSLYPPPAIAGKGEETGLEERKKRG